VNQYGLLGNCISTNRRAGKITVGFNKSREESKVHDPFLGQKAITSFNAEDEVAANKAR